MGCSQSISVFSEEELICYEEVTGLTSAEILHAFKKFYVIDPLAFNENKKGRIPLTTVAETLPELRANPLRYRICHVFCSSESGFMDFDDFLDLVSVMSNRAPLAKKLRWAFVIYDFNDDAVLCPKDISLLLDLITGGKLHKNIKDKIIKQVFAETDLDNDGVIGYNEFERVITLHSGPEFSRQFRFVL